MDLTIDNYAVLRIGDLEIWITETIVNTWIIMGVLIILAVIARIGLKNYKAVPSGLQNVTEAVVESFDKFATGALSPKLSYVSPWFFSTFLFILFSALSSVIGLRAPTADWATTFALALVSFFLMVFLGIKHRKGDYGRDLLVPHPVFLPVNLIGELAKPVSLSFRLFGNMLSGTILLALYYGLTPILAHIGIPAILHGIFDVAFGALQTYIFVIISMMYIYNAAA